MRNALPAMGYVQTQRVSLAGHVGIGVEGSNATVQGDDQYHTNSGNTLAVPPLEPYGPSTRYFDIFSRGTGTCEWTATPINATFLQLSPSSGTITPDGAGDTRVLISANWASAPAGLTTVSVNVTNTCRGLDKYAYPWPLVQVPVQNRVLPLSFSRGFVESDGHVAIDAANYQAIVPGADAASATLLGGDAVGNLTYHTFKGLARTGDGVGLWPQATEKLTAGQAPALEYQLYLYSNSSKANVTVWINPGHNYLGDADPLQYAVALYPAGEEPANVTVVSPVGRSVGTNLPPNWGYAVADNVWGRGNNLTTSSFNVPQEGAYTLRIWALMPSVIFQRVVVNMGGVRPSYLGPPQSFLLGTDLVGEYNGTSVL